MTLDRGGFPASDAAIASTPLQLEKVPHETRFYRYDDHGLQFSFGSADFTGLVLMRDGTFTFQNGYKMEFSSARQFKEQSEGLFDDLQGTYDILWGEMREEEGRKGVRRRRRLLMQVEEGVGAVEKQTSGIGTLDMNMNMNMNMNESLGPTPTANAPQTRRGGMGDKRKSSRFGLAPVKRGLEKLGSRMSLKREKSKMRMNSTRSIQTKTMTMTSPGGTMRALGQPVDEGDEAGAGMDVYELVPLEVILHPSDKEARRKGIDLTQRWGCFAPEEQVEGGGGAARAATRWSSSRGAPGGMERDWKSEH